ncbi:hypothetical protein GCM10028807_13240 [Spirosoma daeguense]
MAYVDQKHKEFYPPAVYEGWALAALDFKNFTQMSNAINSYFNMYLYQDFTYHQIKQFIEDGKLSITPTI